MMARLIADLKDQEAVALGLRSGVITIAM